MEAEPLRSARGRGKKIEGKAAGGVVGVERGEGGRVGGVTGGIETVTAELMRFCPDDAATSPLLFPFRSQSFFP